VVPVTAKRCLTVALLIMSALFAGCLGGDDLASDDDTIDERQEGTGTVTGSIFTLDLQPINNAQVRLVQGEHIASEGTTDPQGRYTLRNVEPGEYRLQVSAACCRENVRVINVVEDETTTADLQLEPWTEDDLQIPRVERYEWTGFLACTLRFFNPPGPHHDMDVDGIPLGVSGVNVCGLVEIVPAILGEDPITDDDFLHVFEAGPGLKTVVGGMEWRAPGAALGDELAITMEVNGRPNQAPRYASTVGHSPLEFRADAGHVVENYEEEIDDHNIHQYEFDNLEDNLELMFRIFAGGMMNIVYQQQFTVYYDLYYWEPAPEDATALPDL
jgi:hypothetical protein